MERGHHVQHGDLDLLAGARPLAREQREHDAVGGHRSRGQVGD